MYATLEDAISVGWSVRRAVGLLPLIFFEDFAVSRLAETFTVPAQSHATDIAVIRPCFYGGKHKNKH